MFAVPQSAQPSITPQTAQQADVSETELRRLRSAAFPDIRRSLAGMYNETESEISTADLENEFQQCHVTAVQLGELGRALVVEGNAGHGKTNAAMLNVYVPSNGGYRLIIATAGWGPITLPGSRPIPDLAFGWSAGADSKLFRYRYRKGKYEIDACDRVEADSETPTACEGKLPTFPYPFKTPPTTSSR